MRIYFAPLEGITGYLYRNAFHEFFGEGIDKYFTPFIATIHGGNLKKRSLTDVLPENNERLPIVPQILGNNAEDFIALCGQLKQLGYEEVNLNLGCPYRTVVSKGKGAGFLGKKEELKAFLDCIFDKERTAISIKTRIGKDSPKEFEELLALFAQYPLKELIIHPRTVQDFYANKPNMTVFEQALFKVSMPVCYNGDIFTKEDYEHFQKKYPEVDRIMIGRGFLTNPGLLREIRQDQEITKEEIRAFHNRLYEDYERVMSGEKDTLFKMKELWNYLQYLFEDREEETRKEKYLKQIRKAQRKTDYKAAVNTLFRECEIKQGAGFKG